MSANTRFARASAPLTLKSLLKPTRGRLWVGLGLAVAAHAALTQLRGLTEEHRVAKPLTTQFVKRQPRLTKPLELKKRPQPRRRHVQRQMVSAKPRTRRSTRAALFRPTQVLRSLSRPSVDIGRIAGVRSAQMEPRSIAGTVRQTKEAQQKIDMALDLLDIEALDTGQYDAMVVQDPDDKRDIKGFCRLGAIYAPEFYLYWPKANYSFEFQALIGLHRLARFASGATDIRTEVLGRIALNDRALFKAPWVLFNPTKPSQLSPTQRRNLGEYLRAGGFLFGTGLACFVRGGGIHRAAFRSLKLALLESLRECGVISAIEKLPNSHPVYHCYFDFNGPPGGLDTDYSRVRRDRGHPEEVRIAGYVEGIEVEGRLLALLSGKAYGYGWAVMGPGGVVRTSGPSDPNPSFRFGVNTIVLALTQEGSITHRLMESVR